MHWQFDIRTAVLLGAALTFLAGAMLQAVSYSQPQSERGTLRWWVLGAFSYALGFGLTGCRGWIWIGLSTVLANALIAFGLSCFAIAVRRFFGLREHRARLWLLVTGALLASAWFVFVIPDDRGRYISTAIVFGIINLSCVRAVYRPGQRPSISQHVTGFYFALGSAMLLVRVVALSLLDVPQPSIFDATLMSILLYAVGALLPVAGTIAFLLMCTERGQRELERSARLDYLTGIYNRGAIEDMGARQISAAVRHGLPLALMVVDIDHFKRVNDDFGHAAGDKALAAVVRMIQGFLRAEDLVGRLGGEEFVVLMPDTDAVQARHAAERMRAAVEAAPLSFFGVERVLTVSIGVAEYRAEDEGFARLLQRADRALYSAKHAGRNRVLVDLMAPATLAPL